VPVAGPPDSLAETIAPQIVEEEPAEPERPARRGVLIGGAAAGVVAIVIAGVLLLGGDDGRNDQAAQRGTPTPTAQPSATVSTGEVSLALPPGWQVAQPPAFRNLDLESQVGARSSSGALVAGLAEADTVGRNLLPTGFARGLDLSKRETVRLPSGDEAYRYDGVEVPDAVGPVTLLVAPTNDGVATVACVDADGDCARVAGTLTVSDLTLYPLGPDQAYADLLNRDLGSLDASVAAGAKRMREARSADGQGERAGEIEDAVGRVERRLRDQPISPAELAAHRRLMERLRAVRDAYGDLAAAAHGDRRGAYNTAAGNARRAHARVGDALDSLKANGYEGLLTAGLPAPELPSLRRPAATATPTSDPTRDPTREPTRTAVPTATFVPTQAPITPTPTPIRGGGDG
jgi:hypothetical protein